MILYLVTTLYTIRPAQYFFGSSDTTCYIAYLFFNHVGWSLKFLAVWPTFYFGCLFLHNRKCKYKVKEDDIIILLETVADPEFVFFVGQQTTTKISVGAPIGLWRGDYLALPLETWGRPALLVPNEVKEINFVLKSLMIKRILSSNHHVKSQILSIF